MVALVVVLVTAAMAPTAGAAAATCKGLDATIVGTPDDDVLEGTPGRDVIAAKGGNDVVNGKGGNDVICGGRGTDKLIGGKGNDSLRGGPGDDKLRGKAGDDKLRGQGHDDALFGGSGTDHCNPGKGFATMEACESYAPPTGSVGIVDFDFSKPEIEVSVGTTVVWTNRDQAIHTVTSLDGTWGSGLLSDGETFAAEFDKPGTYTYFCYVHPPPQMPQATVVVTE